MIDITLIRENAEQVQQALDKKKFKVDVQEVLDLDTKRREIVTLSETKRSEQKKASQEMASMQKGSDEFIAKVKERKVISAESKKMEAEAKEANDTFKAALMEIPNIPHESVPVGKTEDENVEVAAWGNKEEDAFTHSLPHYDIPWFAEHLDFNRGSKVTGAGFPFYIGDTARMVRALIQFFLDEAGDAGYQELTPPILVNAASATATGQLPDKEGQMYVAPEDELYVIPTAEVPVTNFYRDEILDKKNLPLNACAYSPCFRREAGSWGKHVRGLNRLHQFDKVEVVKWVDPETSFDELEAIREHSESILKKLELPFRTLLMCSGDIGFPHSKQYDLEVWAGGQKRWLEVSSCSNFTDFQARRANIRYRDEDGKVKHVHTLNGSALAIPRVLAAILENNLQEDGTVQVPAVLKKWFNKDFIGTPK